jgi:hypothetical protein
MLTKEYIKDLQTNGNGAIGHLKRYQRQQFLTFILENLGYYQKNLFVISS